MRKNSIFILLALLGLLFMACDKDDDSYMPDAKVTAAFNQQYKDAKQVEWEQKGKYQTVEFRLNETEMEAWYDNNGKWLMTESDILFTALPEAVKNTFATDEYASWQKEDVDKLERADREMAVYVIEVEQGAREMDLYYNEDGTFIKAVNGDNQPDHSPDGII